jgi:hypothetical protein
MPAPAARLFLGDNTLLERLVTPWVNDLVTSHALMVQDFLPIVFLEERGYSLNKGLRHVLDSLIANGLSDKKTAVVTTIELPEDKDAPNSLGQVTRDAIRSAVASGRRTIVLMSCHRRNGSNVLRFLNDDSSLPPLTILGHQSICSDENLQVTNQKNQVIILGQSLESLSRSVLVEFREQQHLHPGVFSASGTAPDTLLYVRRCIAGLDLAIATAASPAEFRAANGKKLVVKTSVGNLAFDERGVELGNYTLVLHRRGGAVDYPMQFNSENVLVPNIHFMLRNVKIVDVDLNRNTFTADLSFRVQCSEAGAQRLFAGDRALTASKAAEALSDIMSFTNAVNREYDRRVVSAIKSRGIIDILYHVSGEFRGALDGHKFPFDEQQVVLTMRALRADDALHLSTDRYGALRGADDMEVTNGWSIKETRVTIDQASDDDVPVGWDDTVSNESVQYSQVSVAVRVRRSVLAALMLIVVPLVLLMVASNAVLFWKVTSAGAGATAEAAGEPSQMQSELTFACLLAVTTFLVSYSEFTPRRSQLIYSDYLLVFTLFITTINFVVTVAIQSRSPRCSRLFAPAWYRWVASTFSLAFALGWLAYGLAM